jgi:predicted DNA binding protein
MTGMKVMKLRVEPIDPYNIGYETIFSRIKRLSVLSSMMETPKKYIAVIEVVWNDASDITILSDLEFFDKVSEIVSSDNTYLYLVIGRHLPYYSQLYMEMIETFDCFFQYPLVFKKEKIYLSIAGKQKNLNDFVSTLSESGMPFKVVSIRPYYLKGRGILSSLTPKQYDCLRLAVNSGLYDIPKRCDTRKLAKKKDISHSTFSMHLRKAEKVIFKELFE